jgi:hypothetical protein
MLMVREILSKPGALLQDERQMHIIDPSVILNKAFNG